MNCFICGSQAQVFDDSHCTHLSCPQCGAYRISQAAAQEMARDGLRLDVELSRRWISSYRGSVSTPMFSVLVVRQRAQAGCAARL
ncbi:hypothetical protein HNP46_000996 [Pseudomonas nitritireducens]|uniref:Uncharacterized protein n=1 Tax=Pseudomonas nitroreducens TaxID=46680 RepID=A0A7W7KHH1_PSENT|nr:hypothetical protein [Pseudomonas nitritireducens]MBB4862158.1 hypothetical protein [Pseudomonas nitritireducens]